MPDRKTASTSARSAADWTVVAIRIGNEYIRRFYPTSEAPGAAIVSLTGIIVNGPDSARLASALTRRHMSQPLPPSYYRVMRIGGPTSNWQPRRLTL